MAVIIQHSLFRMANYDDAIGYEKKITGGTITVAVSGSTYTITINYTLEGGGTAKGAYKGSLTASN